VSKPLLHVIFSPSGAGTLRQTLAQQGRTDRVACPYDDFSFGPIAKADGAARAAWVEEELGVSDWESVVATTAPFLEASCSNDVLPVAWISRRDARTYAGFLWWLSHLGNAACRIVDVTELTVSDDPADPASRRLAISPSILLTAQMAGLLGMEVDLDPRERSKHQARWTDLVSDNAPLRIVDRHGSLMSGPICHYDPRLIACATTAWQKMARIIGHALASFSDEGVHYPSDLLLLGRARTLAETGALEWRGDLSTMWDCELRLPASAQH